MKANDYKILMRAIEEGVHWGWERARKHTSTPDEKVIKEEMMSAVVEEICFVFDFDNDVEEVKDE